MGVIKDLWDATGGTVVGTGLGLALEGHNDRRQREQQKKLQQIQIKGQKEMADYNQGLALDMWNKTNYEAQVSHLNNAGLNPALLYGQGGGGGTTANAGGGGNVTGGQAPNGGGEIGMALQLGLHKAQKEVLESQANKNNVEAEKTAGVDTTKTNEEAAGLKFQNELNKAIGITQMQRQYDWATELIELKFTKENEEYNAWHAANFAGKPTDDPNSPLAKAMKAGLEKSLEELQAAKTANDTAKAELIIKQFESNMTKQGLDPKSPWYVKFVGDMLGKAGINLTKDTVNVIKH